MKRPAILRGAVRLGLTAIVVGALSGAALPASAAEKTPDHMGVGAKPPADAVSLTTSGRARLWQAQGDADDSRKDREDAPAEELVVDKHNLLTRTSAADARVHIEWLSPPGGEGQHAGNSGVFLQRRYEIQVLNTGPEESPKNNTAGAIYGVKAPDVNASKGAGQWQAYDIWFHAPRFDDQGKKTKNARITVYWNGKLIHDDAEIPRPTSGNAPAESATARGVQIDKLMVQHHPTEAQGPVRYRNVWIAPLSPPKVTDGDWRDLVGDSLDGWERRGGDATYELKDGNTVVGTSAPNTSNTFLVAPGDFGDFELEYEVKLSKGFNSGLQFRSIADPSRDQRRARVRGYQCEADPSARAWSAGIYDEARRGWLYPLFQDRPAREAYKQGEWNKIRVRAVGPVVRTWLNGVPAAEMFDALTLKGLIALQVHAVGGDTDPHHVYFRNLRIRPITSENQ